MFSANLPQLQSKMHQLSPPSSSADQRESPTRTSMDWEGAGDCKLPRLRGSSDGNPS